MSFTLQATSHSGRLVATSFGSWFVIGFGLTVTTWCGSVCAAESRPADTRPAETRPAESRPAESQPSEPHPNIILISANTLPGATLGFEGNRQIKTPCLDGLAADSVRFTRCYVPTPQGAPGRACMLTGQYPHTHGVTRDGLSPSATADTVSARLKKAGYACGFVGNWQLGDRPDHMVGHGFSDYVALSAGPESSWLDRDVWVKGQAGKADKYLTDWEADRAIDFIASSKAKPFFLWLSFHAPQEPLQYPPGMEQAYPPSSIELPKTIEAESQVVPASLRTAPAFKRFQETPNRKRSLPEMRSKYYAMVTRVDENVGRILKQLDALKLTGNTVVVFTSCTGWAMGDRQLLGGGPFFYEEMIRVPLIVRLPGKAASKVSRLASVLDLAPTFLELAGLRPPLAMQGRSLLPLVADPEAARADEVFLEFDREPGYKPPSAIRAPAQPAAGAAPGSAPPATQPRPGATASRPVGGPPGAAAPAPTPPPPLGAQPAPAPADHVCAARGIVTRQYKYVHYQQHADADILLDLKRDPDELQNQAKVPAYGGGMSVPTGVLKVLQERIERWKKDTRDKPPTN